VTRRKTYKTELEIHKKIISSIGSGFYKISLYRSNTITDKQDILDNAMITYNAMLMLMKFHILLQ